MQHPRILNSWQSVSLLFLALAALSWTYQPLFSSSETILGHSTFYNGLRTVALKNALLEGQSGRWIDSFGYGWGYPIFHYTAPTPYLLAAVYMLFGFSLELALNMTWALSAILSCVTMFLVMHALHGRSVAFLSAVSYGVVPYHLIDIFVRANLGEAFVFCAMPLMYFGVVKVAERPFASICIGGLGVALVACSHFLSLLLVGIAFTFFCCVRLFWEARPARFIGLAALLGASGLTLSALVWVPAVLDLGMVHGASILQSGRSSATYPLGYHYYGYHFVSLTQLLFEADWGYGFSHVGENDAMPFSLGAVFVVLCSVSGLLALWGVLRARALRSVIVNPSDAAVLPRACLQDPQREKVYGLILTNLLVSLFLLFMITEYSYFIWNRLDVLGLLQFPWRFLLPLAFFQSLLIGYLAFLFPAHLSFSGPIATPVAMSIATLIVFGGSSYVPRERGMEFSGQVGDKFWQIKEGILSTSSRFEFLPKEVKRPPAETDISESGRVEMRDKDGIFIPRIEGYSIESGKVKVQLARGAPGVLRVFQHWHPAWKARAGSKELLLERDVSHDLSPLKVFVPADATSVTLEFGLTRSNVLGILLSTLTVVLFSLMAFGFLSQSLGGSWWQNRLLFPHPSLE